MKNFNDYQLTLLERAIEEEVTKDVRVHARMKQETAELYAWYDKYPEDEIAYLALLDLLGWWGVYFSCGYETAKKIQEKIFNEKEEIYRKELAAANGSF